MALTYDDSRVIKSPKCSALGTTVPARLLQEALVIFVFKQISQFGSFGKCVNCACPSPVPLLLATPLVTHEKNWKCLDVQASVFCRGTKGLLSSTKFFLHSCSQSGKSCNKSLCTSSRPCFLFSVSVGLCCWFLRSSSPVLPLLSVAGFSVSTP